MTRYAVGLGSNLGDRLEHLVAAVAELDERFDVVAVSPLYETLPVGGPEQSPFLNAVVVIETDMEPHGVLEVGLHIEQARDRERTERWGPRTLDLDIIASDGTGHDGERLTIPHPRAIEREFVLRPLSDVWPEAPAGRGLTAAAALDRLDDQGVDRLTDDWIPPRPRWKATALLAGQMAIFAASAATFIYDGTLPGGDWSVVRVLGGLTALVGASLAFESSRRLGGSMAAGPIPRQDGDLIVSGPYRHARHPIYGGVSLLFIGASLLLDSVVGLAVSALLIPYFLLKARYEERQLRMRYAGYLHYRLTVRRRLIPFVV